MNLTASSVYRSTMRALGIVGQQFVHRVIAHQRHDAFAGFCRHALHVVGVRYAEVVIEALLRRQELRLIADMPFADAHRGVAFLFEEVGDRVLLRVESIADCRDQTRPAPRRAAVTTRQQLRPRDASRPAPHKSW